MGLTDRDIVSIRYGDSALINFDVYRSTCFKATVTEIGNAADPYTGTYEVELTVDPVKDKKLISGFIAKVDIYPGSLKKKYLSVPIDALTDYDESGGYVYVIEDSTVARKRVEFTKIFNDEALINAGLLPGSKIVTDGISYINDSIKIEIHETSEISDR